MNTHRPLQKPSPHALSSSCGQRLGSTVKDGRWEGSEIRHRHRGGLGLTQDLSALKRGGRVPAGLGEAAGGAKA